MEQHFWGCQTANEYSYLTVNCKTAVGQPKWQINTKKHKSKPKTNSEDNLYT